MIDVPPESQVYRQVVRKEADARSIAVDPAVRLYFVDVEEPQLASPRSDVARLLDALEREWSLRDISVDPVVLRSIQRDLRRAPAWQVTVAVHDESTVSAIWPGFHDVASASRSTSARRPSPGISAICTRARCWRPPAR